MMWGTYQLQQHRKVCEQIHTFLALPRLPLHWTEQGTEASGREASHLGAVCLGHLMFPGEWRGRLLCGAGYGAMGGKLLVILEGLLVFLWSLCWRFLDSDRGGEKGSS